MIQKTLVLIKPDAVEKNLIGEIIRRYENAGLKVVELKMQMAPKNIVEKHYPMERAYLESIGEKTIAAGQQVKSAYDQGKKVVSWLRQFISSGAIIAMVLEGEDAVAVVREITGFTDPSTAQKGTIRADLGTDSILKANMEERPVYNLIHASGSLEEAEKEINLWFGE